MAGTTEDNGEIDGSKIETRELHTFEDGATYEGEWVGDKMHGRGCYIKNNHKYFGDFKANKYSGNGRMTWENGDSYDGHWEDDQFTGKGVFYDQYGNRNGGIWKENK